MSNFYDFIEIGTSDFSTLLQAATPKQRGISVEALGYYLDRLPDKENVHKVCCAVSDTEGEEVEMHYVTQETMDKYNLPFFVRGNGNIDGNHPFMKILLSNQSNDHPLDRVYSPDEVYTKEKVPTRRLKSIIDEFEVDEIKILKIDTEGHDATIVRDYMTCCRDEGYPKPYFLKFEHILIPPGEKAELFDFVRDQGYYLTKHDVENAGFLRDIEV